MAFRTDSGDGMSYQSLPDGITADPNFVPARAFLPAEPGTREYSDWLTQLDAGSDTERALAGRVRDNYGS